MEKLDKYELVKAIIKALEAARHLRHQT